MLALALAACGAGPDDGEGLTVPVLVSVDTTTGRRPISPLVYGWNGRTRAAAPPGATWLRLGGNRWTAYNWTGNFSNAGIDWGPWSSDEELGTPADGPGAAARATLEDARGTGVAVQVTIPMQGWVARDAAGVVDLARPLPERFVPILPRKGSAFTLAPDPASDPVYADEFAAWCADRWGSGPGLGFALDNEPDLWAVTHREIQREPLTYAALLERSVATAAALKDAVPGAEVFGPESYGWLGFVSLQDAPDAGGRDFLDFYLDGMRAASGGRRLLDVLDLHFYAQAEGCGVGVTDARSPLRNSDCVVAARVQAPRSLYDPTYVEPSWITRWSTRGTALRLLPRMRAKLEVRWPGTRLGLGEYQHGGGDHVSGAVAQADALGALGREGVYAAALWPLSTDETWTSAAWRAYRDPAGEGWGLGDVSVPAVSADLEHVSAWAGVSTAAPDRVVVVLVHRPGAIPAPGLGVVGMDGSLPRAVRLAVTHATALTRVRAWRLENGPAPAWTEVEAAFAGGAVTLVLPHLSVTVLVLEP